MKAPHSRRRAKDDRRTQGDLEGSCKVLATIRQGCIRYVPSKSLGCRKVSARDLQGSSKEGASEEQARSKKPARKKQADSKEVNRNFRQVHAKTRIIPDCPRKGEEPRKSDRVLRALVLEASRPLSVENSYTSIWRLSGFSQQLLQKPPTHVNMALSDFLDQL